MSLTSRSRHSAIQSRELKSSYMAHVRSHIVSSWFGDERTSGNKTTSQKKYTDCVTMETKFLILPAYALSNRSSTANVKSYTLKKTLR